MSDAVTNPIQVLEAQLDTLKTLKDNNTLLLELTSHDVDARQFLATHKCAIDNMIQETQVLIVHTRNSAKVRSDE